MRPLRRPGALCMTVPVACATASGATDPSPVKPVGLSRSVSSATFDCTKRVAPVSASRAKTWTAVVVGSAPTRPTIAADASLVSVPRSWPAKPSLNEPPVSDALGSLMTLKM